MAMETTITASTFVTLTDTATFLDMTGDAWSVLTMINLAPPSGFVTTTRTIYNFGNPTGSTYMWLGVSGTNHAAGVTAGRLVIHVRIGGISHVSFHPTPVPVDEWVGCSVVRRNNGTISLYLDGDEEVDAIIPSGTIAPSNTARIGRDTIARAETAFEGDIAHVAKLDRSLQVQEAEAYTQKNLLFNPKFIQTDVDFHVPLYNQGDGSYDEQGKVLVAESSNMAWADRHPPTTDPSGPLIVEAPTSQVVRAHSPQFAFG